MHSYSSHLKVFVYLDAMLSSSGDLQDDAEEKPTPPRFPSLLRSGLGYPWSFSTLELKRPCASLNGCAGSEP